MGLFLLDEVSGQIILIKRGAELWNSINTFCPIKSFL